MKSPQRRAVQFPLQTAVDAQPTLIDTDEDGVDDRLCWVTWYRIEHQLQ